MFIGFIWFKGYFLWKLGLEFIVVLFGDKMATQPWIPAYFAFILLVIVVQAVSKEAVVGLDPV